MQSAPIGEKGPIGPQVGAPLGKKGPIGPPKVGAPIGAYGGLQRLEPPQPWPYRAL